jgi:hypothetical protein
VVGNRRKVPGCGPGGIRLAWRFREDDCVPWGKEESRWLSGICGGSTCGVGWYFAVLLEFLPAIEASTREKCDQARTELLDKREFPRAILEFRLAQRLDPNRRMRTFILATDT